MPTHIKISRFLVIKINPPVGNRLLHLEQANITSPIHLPTLFFSLKTIIKVSDHYKYESHDPIRNLLSHTHNFFNCINYAPK
jgi:hypothetical protein